MPIEHHSFLLVECLWSEQFVKRHINKFFTDLLFPVFIMDVSVDS